MNRCSEKAAFWEYVLAEQVESGLSISAFCRREGVSQASFYQWRKKLSGEFVNGTAASDRTKTGFVPVEIVSADDPTALNDPAALPGQGGQGASANHVSASLTIRTPDGYAVDISAGTLTEDPGRVAGFSSFLASERFLNPTEQLFVPQLILATDLDTPIGNTIRNLD